MTRIRNVLQHRADRFRNRQTQKQLLRDGDNNLLLTSSHDHRMQFNDHLVKPQMEPNGASSDCIYSLEAKDTHETAVETFSSGEENTAYSDENRNGQNTKYLQHDRREAEDSGEFLDLAYEASRQKNNTTRGHDFIDLVEESSATKRESLNNFNQRDHKDEEENYGSKTCDQPKTIQFVDSEDGKVFNIAHENQNKEKRTRGGSLQNVRSLDDSNTLDNDECSKTLNTNTETLHTMQSLDVDDIEQVEFSNRFRNLQVDIGERGEDFEECVLKEEYISQEKIDLDEQIPLGDSRLYDCDDGEMYVPVGALDAQQGSIYSDQGVQYEEDGNFFEQLRNVQSRHGNSYHHPEHTGIVQTVQPEKWQSMMKEQNHFETQQSSYIRRQNVRPVSPQLEDPYLSDDNSSWEEGSFATGASRTVSRVDTACDDDESYYGTYDETEYYSDDETYGERKGDRPFVRMLKKLRKMNAKNEQSHSGSSDDEFDEAYDDKKKILKKRRKRRQKNNSVSSAIFDSIRQIGTDILDETIDYAEKQDQLSRQNGGNASNTIISSFTELLSCGVSSPY